MQRDLGISPRNGFHVLWSHYSSISKRGSPGTPTHSTVQTIVQFHTVFFLEILTKSYVGAPCRVDPPPTGNPGSAPAIHCYTCNLPKTKNMWRKFRLVSKISKLSHFTCKLSFFYLRRKMSLRLPLAPFYPSVSFTTQATGTCTYMYQLWVFVCSKRPLKSSME